MFAFLPRSPEDEAVRILVVEDDDSIADAVMQFLPMVIASSSLSTTIPEPHSLGAWSGSAVILAYVGLFGAAALVRFRHRDA